MTHICPHCLHPGVPLAAARSSEWGRPAVCAFCGGLSQVLPRTSLGIFVRSVLLLVMVLVVAAGFASLGIAASAACVAVAHYLWAWEHVSLVTAGPGAAATA